MTTPIDDDTLVAYLDGRLDDAHSAQIEARLAEDEAARRRLDELAQASELARRAFDPVLREPLPPTMIDAIWRATDPRRASRWRAWLASVTRLQGGWSVGGPRLALASLVLALGVGWLAQGLWRGDALQAGDTLAEGSLTLALDTAHSGEVLRTRTATLELLGSFLAADGRACRALQQRSGEVDTLAVACRDGGAWQVAFAESGSADRGADGYAPASDARAEAADAYLREVLRASSLDESEERGFIARGWDR
ncbi:anti-sigma factor family protein [Hydrogenophaga sp. XSHU_21]